METLLYFYLAGFAFYLMRFLIPAKTKAKLPMDFALLSVSIVYASIWPLILAANTLLKDKPEPCPCCKRTCNCNGDDL
jgi:hypothetical protein